jgi:hypothetical protein
MGTNGSVLRMYLPRARETRAVIRMTNHIEWLHARVRADTDIGGQTVRGIVLVKPGGGLLVTRRRSSEHRNITIPRCNGNRIQHPTVCPVGHRLPLHGFIRRPQRVPMRSGAVHLYLSKRLI